MAGQTDQTRAQIVGKEGLGYRRRLLDRMKQAVGNRASDAVKLTPDEELQRWMLPTSDAALIALKNGGTLSDAIEANTLSVNAARQQQQMLTQQMTAQGAKPDDVFKVLQQQGLTDDQIFQAHQKYAYGLGKSNSGGSPAKEADYHERMAGKAWALRQQTQQPSIQTVEQGV